jgi:two-component system, OmpR family, sensor histidine kinase KdpD
MTTTTMGPHPRLATLGHLALALAALIAVTLVYSRWIGVTNPTIVALTYLLVVLLVAALSTLSVAIASSVLAVLATNYFFLPPVGTLTIADPQNWVVLFVLLVVSVTASQLASSARARAREAIARRDELSQLFDLSRDILLTTESAEAHQHLARSIARRFDLGYVAVCLPGPDAWRLHEAGALALTLPRGELDEILRAAKGVIEFDARERTYGGHRTIVSREGVRVGLVPLRLGGRAIGLLASAGRQVEPGTLDALAGVAAIAVERTQFLDERKAAELARQSNELKSALLASLGHDLRTPLTAIRVAASNLLGSWLSEDERRAQTEIVLGEVERLSRLFQNILDMARIETNAVTAQREWVVPEEIVGAAVAQVQQALRDHRLQVRAASEHAVQVDPRLTAAALAHLIENAAHYSPPGTTISIDATPEPDGLTIVVRDQGPGISEADLPRLFERFYRGGEGRRHSIGAGMGLAITRGLLAAEGGRVWAENQPEGGARFSIAVPAAVRPAPVEPGEHP